MLGPAHTAGDVLAWVPDDRTVFTGDLLFIGGTPIMWAGPVGNWLAACDRILEMDAENIVPGHGPMTDAAAIYDAVYQAGQDLGLQRLGWGTYLVNHVEGGFPQQTWTFAPAFDPDRHPEIAGFWRNVSGSVDPADRRARTRTPVEVRWHNMARFDHDFPGRDALQAEMANPLYRSYLTGFEKFEPVIARPTLASAIQIGNPVSYPKAIETLRFTSGDEEIRAAPRVAGGWVEFQLVEAVGIRSGDTFHRGERHREETILPSLRVVVGGGSLERERRLRDNVFAEQVASLYAGMDLKKFY